MTNKSRIQGERSQIRCVWDAVAGLALLFSLVSVGWQVKDRLVGAEIKQLDYSGYLVELRCNSGKASTCWNGDGHLVVVLPVFFANTGAADYNEAVERVTLDLLVDDATRARPMLATAFWHTTQNASRRSTPFRPIVIGGRSSSGHELRFVGNPPTRLDWSDFVDNVIDESVKSITLITRATFSIETEPLERTCTVEFGKGHREVLSQARRNYQKATKDEDRRKVRKYIATYCE